MPVLDWHGRDEDLTRAARAPYRLLERVDALSHGDPGSPNMLVEGDNLEALKALLPYYAGQVKCIFIDPPYNTGNAFEHYDDNLEHSKWLSMMHPRLELLRELLAEDGSLWVTLDDNEAHYFKVICDEIFGRKNFVSNLVWQKKYAASNDSKTLSNDHDHILVFARDIRAWTPNKLPRTAKSDRAYKNPDNDPRGPWQSDNYTCNKSIKERPNLYYPIRNPFTGEDIYPRKTAVWRYSRERHAEHVEQGLVYWGAEGRNSVPRFKRFLSEVEAKGANVQSVWSWEDVGHNQDAKREQLTLDPDAPFSTPKPERLLQRIIQIATDNGDIVLDSFLGSGTSAAVAHKLDRRWIGIEMGEHARTHCQPRLRRVVDGEQGGISKAVGWQGGGGFHFYRLGMPVFDADGRISDGIGFEQIAAHVWFSETGVARAANAGRDAFLGEHHGTGYYLLFNGILGDAGKDDGNVLTRQALRTLRPFEGPKVIYGEACALPEEQLRELGIVFRQTPYDIRAR